jgi:hypothetical protein
MAYYILFNSTGQVYKISDSEEEKNILSQNLTAVNVVTTTESIFNGLKFETIIANYVNNNVVTTPLMPEIKTSEAFNEILRAQKNSVNGFLNNNSSSPLFNKWNSYKSILNTINSNGVNFPLNENLASFITNKGNTVPSILQLP